MCVPAYWKLPVIILNVWYFLAEQSGPNLFIGFREVLYSWCIVYIFGCAFNEFSLFLDEIIKW